MKLKIFGKPESNDVVEQMNVSGKNADYGVLCGDNHLGYSQPVGGALAYRDQISVSGVGFDIACGNKAVKTNIKSNDVDISKVMDEIFDRISFGVGRKNNEPIDHEVIDSIGNSSLNFIRNLKDLAAQQLGTVGSGNHYVDLFKDDEDNLWIGVHFGSRGFGHKIATAFMAVTEGKNLTDKPSPESFIAPAKLLGAFTPSGESYIESMQIAGEYAYAGRDVVVDKVLEILGAKSTYSVHNHHNFAWRENHHGKDYWVIRKGCTPAFPGQEGFVGGSMGDVSVILEGVDSNDSKKGLYSTVHGAGRVMSRTQAAGKKKWIKGEDGVRRPTVVSPGLIDWESVQSEIKSKGVELRGAGADEAPGVYKKLSEVLSAHEGTIKIKHVLTPIGVAMAGAGEFDPYKD